jgi:hypothetical protein
MRTTTRFAAIIVVALGAGCASVTANVADFLGARRRAAG